MKVSKKKAKQMVDGAIELAINSISNALSNLLKIKCVLRSEDNIYMARSPLEDARKCVSHMGETLEAADEVIMSTLPKRPNRPTGLKITPKGLNTFDTEYFDYFNPETEEGKLDFYKQQYKDKDALYCHLTTWVFDDGDTRAALNEIKKSFGEKAYKIVLQKLKDGDHDT